MYTVVGCLAAREIIVKIQMPIAKKCESKCNKLCIVAEYRCLLKIEVREGIN